MAFSDLPISSITAPSTEYPDLTSVVGPPTPDVVSPSIANQQPDQLATRTDTLHDRVNKIITTLNEMATELLQRDGVAVGSAMKGDLDMTNPATSTAYKVVNVQDGVSNKDAVTKDQLDVLTTSLNTLTATMANVVLRDGSLAMTGNFDGGSNRVVNLADPSGNQDVATKNYVDGLSSNVSNEYLKRDGSNAMLSNLDMGAYRVTNAANPTGATDAVTKGWMDGQLSGIGTAPAGSLAYYAGVETPAGWLACDGTSYSQTSYSNLFIKIGITYNLAGDASDSFRVPDLRGRYLAGLDEDAGRITRASLDALGETDGSEYVTLVTANLPSHEHTYTDSYALAGSGTDTGPTATSGGFYINTVGNSVTASTGSGTAHENCPPTMALNIIIKT